MAEQQKKQQSSQDLNELLKVRREKLDNLREAGKDPFVITKYPIQNILTRNSLRIYAAHYKNMDFLILFM